MSSNLTELILQNRQIAYLITNNELLVIDKGGDLSILSHHLNLDKAQTLFDCIPELVGQEQALAEILTAQLARYEIPLINRTNKLGDTDYLTIVLLPYRNEDNQITGVLVLGDDVTEIGRSEQQVTQQRNELSLAKDQLAAQNIKLEVANAELKRLDALRSRFVSVAAHELRTPLSSIYGYLEVLLDEDLGPIPKNQSEYLEIMQNSAFRLLTITNNLLDITRIEAERIELVLEPVVVSIIIESVIKELNPQLQTKEQSLTFFAEPNLPLGLCDKVRLAQIVNNLLSNANKYTPPKGFIKISLTAAKKPGFLQLAVSDNGIGISAEDQEKLFTPFYRADNIVKSRESGAGLGLYIIRSLVDLHGGEIWLQSVVDKGTTFYVTLPAVN